MAPATMTEAEFIRAEALKAVTPTLKALRKMASACEGGIPNWRPERAGRWLGIGREQQEVLLVNGLAEVRPPCAGVPYNHLHVTAAGHELLAQWGEGGA